MILIYKFIYYINWGLFAARRGAKVKKIPFRKVRSGELQLYLMRKLRKSSHAY